MNYSSEGTKGVEEGTQGAELRRARKKKYLTQAEVAEAVGVDTKTVKRWKDNHGTPRGHNCRKLCDLFKATSEDLKLGIHRIIPQVTASISIQMSVEEPSDDIGQLDVEEPQMI